MSDDLLALKLAHLVWYFDAELVGYTELGWVDLPDELYEMLGVMVDVASQIIDITPDRDGES